MLRIRREVHEVRERLLLGLNLDEQVNVTIGTRDVPANRAEQRQAPHAQTEISAWTVLKGRSRFAGWFDNSGSSR